ncbi:MAG: glycosyltransferase, partial [Candidatus Baldrarchaeia archaeon]
IASNIGGIPEISEGCDGVELFQPGNHKQLAEKMLHVKELSKETIVELGIKNRRNVMKKFISELSVKQFINLLTKVYRSN